MTEQQYSQAKDEILTLMNKGEANVTDEESNRIKELGLTLQAYETQKYGL